MIRSHTIGCIIVFALFSGISLAQISGSELLQKAIDFHDPDGNWNNFQGAFEVTMQSPKTSERISRIMIDLPQQVFNLDVRKDGDSYAYNIEREHCEILLNGSSTISKEDLEKFWLSCERGTMYRDYYTYLYGLPMKLKDNGTIIHDKVVTKTFKGKEYLILKVTYDQEVGEDTWYFYFDPKTYAMEVYQFFHDESKNDGEYIVLKDIEEINGIKMPKIREWYYNKNDEHLGTDILHPWGS